MCHNNTASMQPHNHVQLIGRVGHDPELLPLADGSVRTYFRLYQDSTTNRYTATSDTSPPAHHLVAWRSMAERLHGKLRRGDTVLIYGRLVNRWLTTTDGRQNSSRTEVHVDGFRLLSARSRTRSVGLVAEPTAAANYSNHE